MDRTHGAIAALAAISTILTAFLAYGMSRPLPQSPRTIGAYATDLSGRTPHQRYNARRAAASIDGAVIPPGAQFSFNKTVGGWSADRGYLKAPVSYDGVLLDDYGGGVCETSTTLYNAALLAGLTILERHRHTFSPGYAPVGRDAAVAYPAIDLRVRNPYPYPLTIHVGKEGRMLVCRIAGVTTSLPSVRIASQTVQVIHASANYAPRTDRRPAARWHLEGRDGYHVLVYRSIKVGPEPASRDLVSDDTYAPLSAVRRSPG
jgi:vancomycin resistance protein YoaR